MIIWIEESSVEWYTAKENYRGNRALLYLFSYCHLVGNTLKIKIKIERIQNK